MARMRMLLLTRSMPQSNNNQKLSPNEVKQATDQLKKLVRLPDREALLELEKMFPGASAKDLKS
jgi:hypothetical protein